jgi:hypothetical protein
MSRKYIPIALLIVGGIAVYLFWMVQPDADLVQESLKEGLEVVIDDFTLPLVMEPEFCIFTQGSSKLDSPLFTDSKRSITGLAIGNIVASSDSIIIGAGKANFVLDKNCSERARFYGLEYSFGQAHDFSGATKLVFSASEVQGKFRLELFLINEDSLEGDIKGFEILSVADSKYEISFDANEEFIIDLNNENLIENNLRDQIKRIVILVGGAGQFDLGPIKLVP